MYPGSPNARARDILNEGVRDILLLSEYYQKIFERTVKGLAKTSKRLFPWPILARFGAIWVPVLGAILGRH